MSWKLLDFYLISLLRDVTRSWNREHCQDNVYSFHLKLLIFYDPKIGNTRNIFVLHNRSELITSSFFIAGVYVVPLRFFSSILWPKYRRFNPFLCFFPCTSIFFSLPAITPPLNYHHSIFHNIYPYFTGKKISLIFYT